MNDTDRLPTEQPVELGRYEAEDGARVVIGIRDEEIVSVTDQRLDRRGPSYPIADRVHSMDELAVLVRDYLRQAEEYADCPMSANALRQLMAASDLAQIARALR